MAGRYWLLPDDGAPFRCSACGENKKHDEVICQQDTNTGLRKVLCLSCVDKEWLDKAICLGAFDG